MNKNYGYDANTLNLIVRGYSGNNEVIVKCPNPNHSDSNPSSCFNTDSGLLYCFSCGFSANATQLAVLANLTYLPSKQILPNYQKDTEELWLEFDRFKSAKDDEYLNSRGVTNQNIKDFDIRKCSKGIVFLFRDFRGKLIGAQLRQFNKKPKYLTFGQRSLWDLTKLSNYNPSEPIYLTEGVFGAIRGFNAGKQTLAVIGAMIRENSLRPIINYPKIFGLFDNDLAGYIAGARLLKFIPQSSIVIPGLESDELSIENWSKIGTLQTTKSISELKKLSGDEKGFLKYV